VGETCVGVIEGCVKRSGAEWRAFFGANPEIAEWFSSPVCTSVRQDRNSAPQVGPLILWNFARGEAFGANYCRVRKLRDKAL